MKRCPECRRDYYDDTLSFCLDDGSRLLDGPAAFGVPPGTSPGPLTDEPATAILSEPPALAGGMAPSESPTRHQIHTTDQTANFPHGAEAEPQNLSELMERQSLSAHQAAKPQRNFGSRKVLFAGLVVAVVFLVGGFFGYRYFAPFGSKQIESIAVMPFVNESGNADVEYLSDGMTETLIKSLSQLPNLAVKSRSTVFFYKGKETSPKKIGEELGVQAVLLGRVGVRGDDLKLSLELVNTQTQDVIWTEQYDRKQSDLVSLQSETAKDVSAKLKLKLSGADEAKVTKTSTANPEAYKLYLQGRFYWNKREEKEFRKAIDYFNQAVAIDPNYALAFAGLADTYALLFSYDFAPVAEMTKAREFALKAVSLDGTLAEPYATLAVAAEYQYDFASAERDFKRSIELNPNYATARQWYAEMLTGLGRFDEAMAEHRRSIEIDPLSLPLNWTYGRALYFARRYDESLAQLKKTTELDPNFARTHRTLAELYRFKKDYAASVEERAKFAELSGNPQAAALIRETFTKEGWTGYLRLVVSESAKLKDNNWVRAKAYLELGERDAAFAELERAYESRATSLLWIKIEPGLDPLRDDPRYKNLLKRMGLPE